MFCIRQRLIVLSSVVVLCHRLDLFFKVFPFFELVRLTRKFFAVCFSFLHTCLRSCICDWVDPPPLNGNFEKQLFGSRNKTMKIVGEIFELAWRVPESEISCFIVIQFSSTFQHFWFWFWLSELQTVLCGAIFSVPGKWHNCIPSFANWGCRYSTEMICSKSLSPNHLWPFWTSLPEMM